MEQKQTLGQNNEELAAKLLAAESHVLELSDLLTTVRNELDEKTRSYESRLLQSETWAADLNAQLEAGSETLRFKEEHIANLDRSIQAQEAEQVDVWLSICGSIKIDVLFSSSTACNVPACRQRCVRPCLQSVRS